MGRPATMLVTKEADRLRAVMPAARNPYFIFGAIAFGVPWLVTVVIGVVLALRNIPDSRVGLVWIAVLLGTVALTGLLDVLAVGLIWLAFYAVNGSETLEVTAVEIGVRRRALGITMRAHAKRGHFDTVKRLDTAKAPGRVPHPRIEISGAYSRLRVGAGLTQTEADSLAEALGAFLKGCGPE